MTNEELGLLCQVAAVELAKDGLQGAPLADLARKAIDAARKEIRQAQMPTLYRMRDMVKCSRPKTCPRNGTHAEGCRRGALLEAIKILEEATNPGPGGTLPWRARLPTPKARKVGH